VSVQFESIWEDGVWKRKPKKPVGWSVRYELKTKTYKVPSDSYPENNADVVQQVEKDSAVEALMEALTHEVDDLSIQVFVHPIYDPQELPAEGEEDDHPTDV
jgi:hypothetical protein